MLVERLYQEGARLLLAEPWNRASINEHSRALGSGKQVDQKQPPCDPALDKAEGGAAHCDWLKLKTAARADLPRHIIL